jgi:hypothetical protein
VALRNRVNANLVFGLRRLHRRGLLERRDAVRRLLAVKVALTVPQHNLTTNSE